jgi:membrane protein YqaA with SNARE-associated domain
MTAPLAALVGLLAGAHASIWGMFKDAPHEGFGWPKFARSIALGTALGPIVGWLFRFGSAGPADLVLLFGLIYAIERGVAEVYKTFLRNEDQSKYFIPMQLAVRGRPVRSRWLRRLAGLAYVGGILAVLFAVGRIQRGLGPDPSLVLVALIGGAGGWISAIGGAWKDAPIEGFQGLKFIRSPLLATVFAVGLAQLTSNLVTICVAATGFVVAATETYKTFLRVDQPRGKFAGKPILFPDLLRWRRRFIPVFVLIWLLVLGAFLAAVFSDSSDLSAVAGFLAATVWCHGPVSPFLPVAYEPVLLAAGQRYPPLALALVGAVTSTAAEWGNYFLYRRLLRLRPCARMLETRGARRLRAWFSRRPFLTVWVAICSPAPDWAARLLAVQSGYPVRRYLLAVCLARLPRFWFLAALGAALRPALGILAAIVGGSLVVALGARAWRRLAHRTASGSAGPLPSRLAPAPEG